MKKKYRGEIPFWLKNKKNNIVYICSSNRNMEDYFYVLQDLNKDKNRKILKLKKENREYEINEYNYELLKLIENGEKFIILISLDLLLEKYFYEMTSIRIDKEKIFNFNELEKKLIDSGFEKMYMIENKKQYSLRRDILDIFNENEKNPIRIEFFGDKVDRINYFDIETQKSIEKIESIDLYINNNQKFKDFFELLDLRMSRMASPVELGALSQSKKENLNKIQSLKNSSEGECSLVNDNTIKYFYENKDIIKYKIEKNIFDNIQNKDDFEARVRKIEKKLFQEGKEVEIQKFYEEELREFEDIEKVKELTKKFDIAIYSEEVSRYKEIFKGYKINFEKYPLFEGFKQKNKLVLTDRELKGVRVKREKKEKRALKYKSVEQIKENEYVIHENYGVGIFLGLENIENKEYLKIKYADEDKLFVPIEGINKIEKYINEGNSVPAIYNLGTRGFKRKKEKLREDMMIFAKELLEIQAKRISGNGFSFLKDTVWQEEFEEAFPYTETPAQLKAIEDVKRDMESQNVMDRLVCGDVGYGKTEVAIRATFKAIMSQKQVALLVPTTVLAEQHYERFRDRFKNYPFHIELLSRLQTKKEQREILENAKKGVVDLVIGTHRLLSEDVDFFDLGLIIIDEEQKFGVKAKEKLKKLRGNLDVLTLTATPIPRTLNFSLLGIRDLSIIDTSPKGRKKIITEYIENDEKIIKEIIMNEVAREGQVFYVFNSVKKIERKLRELEEILPSYVSISYIHGQMHPKDIKKNIIDFENGEIDVLVSTIIIENGIDIENANTMIIEGVEKLGLSQVYQLRGRIGRSNTQSYCYLLMNENKSKKAAKREESIKKFDNLSGLDLSMEDIKIRGVGEILGDKQHGLVETFGYNLYLKMLNEEISKLKGSHIEEETEQQDINIKLNLEKFIPDYYIDKDEKLKIYKRALDLKTKIEVKELYEEVLDRFGKMPKSAKDFFEFLEIKIICVELGIIELIEEENNFKGATASSRTVALLSGASPHTPRNNKKNNLKVSGQHPVLNESVSEVNAGEQKNSRFFIKFEKDKVNIDKIIELITENKINYIKNKDTIIFKGKLYEFFDLYLEN